MSKKVKKSEKDSIEDEKFPLPIYDKQDDIYSKEKEESFEEDISDKKKLKREDKSLDDGLDIPGTELDDADEIIGEEDEENNYYSLGGDNHEALEEDDQ
jgi:hypothetical protein